MLNNMLLGQYYPVDSFIHHLDPRTKIVSIFIFLCLLFISTNPYFYAYLLSFLIMMVISARIPVKTFLRSIRPIIFIIIATMMLHFFITPGEIFWQWYFLKISEEGLYKGILMAVRLVLLIGYSSLLMLTTTPIALTDGLEHIFGPLKKWRLPVHEIALMISIALRFIPTFIEETDKIMKAQISRGANFYRGNFLERSKNLINLMVPLFISAFKRAEDLALAMEARGYVGGTGRTKMHVLRYDFFDYGVYCLMVINLAASIFLRWGL